MKTIIFLIVSSAILYANDVTVLYSVNLCNRKINNNETFWGLFHDDSIGENFYWQKVVVKVDTFFSAIKGIIDKTYDFPNRQNSLVLIQGLKINYKKTVRGRLFDDYFIKPEDSISYQLKKMKYTLTSQADSIVFICGDSVYYNYKYILIIQDRKNINKYILTGFPYVRYGFLHEYPTILWIGDLDHDNRLDLLFSEKTHYSAISRAIFITSLMNDSLYKYRISVHGSYD